MRLIDVTVRADRDFDDILTFSTLNFGLAASERYAALIERAFIDLAQNPTRPGVVTVPGIPPNMRLYPIRHSRDRTSPLDRVGRARHIVAFRFNEERVEIVRLLHDAMDLVARLEE